MRAVIVEVHKSMLAAAERCLPPDHRIRAERPSVTCANLLDLLIDGPNVIERPDDATVPQADMGLLVSREADGRFRLDGHWKYWRQTRDGLKIHYATSEPWRVGVWDTFEDMMDAIMQGCDARPSVVPVT